MSIKYCFDPRPWWSLLHDFHTDLLQGTNHSACSTITFLFLILLLVLLLLQGDGGPLWLPQIHMGL